MFKLTTSILLIIIGFKYELALCLNGTIPIPAMYEEEKNVFDEFRVSGHKKAYFNYFLIDPQLLQPTLNFKRFVESIFYVGKGKSGRPFQHLKDAKSSASKNLPTDVNQLQYLIFVYVTIVTKS